MTTTVTVVKVTKTATKSKASNVGEGKLKYMRIGSKPPSDLELYLFLALMSAVIVGLIVGEVYAYMQNMQT